MTRTDPQPPQAPPSLYDPRFEKDACGVGFIAQLKAKRSHRVVEDAIHMLSRMDHRGACGAEPNTGDGAGILTAIPEAFFAEIAQDTLGTRLPEAGQYGVGNVFLPRDKQLRQRCKQILNQTIETQGQTLLGWRHCPCDADHADVGPTARVSEPVVEQVFIAHQSPDHQTTESPDQPPGPWPTQDRRGETDASSNEFERQLFTIRKIASARVQEQLGVQIASDPAGFYICSLSSQVIVYKGQLTSSQVWWYYADLREPGYTSHLAMVHSRFSTNTFPSWERAQPMRYMSHNGEINTLQGNVNMMRARQGLMKAVGKNQFGDALSKFMPVVEASGSDSGSLDNALEMLILAGRSLPEAIMMLIPEAWENHEAMKPGKSAFYEYHSNLMEPWDGPASISFTDGKFIGATLDRNGLRPSRYYVTHDDRVIMASEVGVLDLEPENVKEKGRLQPGRMFLVDFDKGRIVSDEEVKSQIVTRRPYGQWLAQQRIDLSELPHAPVRAASAGPLSSEAAHQQTSVNDHPLIARLQAFGYTAEHLNMLMLPMVNKGTESKEPLGSMGNDQALAVLSDNPRLLYDYFKQLFAQVTNPPIDPIREQIIMSLRTTIGPEGNLLETSEHQCHRLHLPQPILTDSQVDAMKALADNAYRGWRSKMIDITYEKEDLPNHGQSKSAPLLAALDRICAQAMSAIDQGYQLIVLSDRNVGPDRVPLSALLAVGAVHHHLVRHESRTRIGLVLESGEPREVHHFCLLFGYGVDAVNPYLAFNALALMRNQGVLDQETPLSETIEHYIRSIDKGLYKTMSKMGISTLASYKGAQIFEAIGLRDEVIKRAFAGTPSRLQGVDFNVLAREALRRHALGFPKRPRDHGHELPNPGEYYWRPEGEHHAFSPSTIARLQTAARHNSKQAYSQYAALCNEDARQRCNLRGLLELKTTEESDEGAHTPKPPNHQTTKPPNHQIPLDEVEPAKEIVKRFRSGAMSLGSLSKEAHETLAVAMNRIGGKSNSGEGGEDMIRLNVLPNGDTKRSAIKQVASGRFGATSYYLANADTLQIKIAQGAKPGEGGQLPGNKVSQYIGKIRYSTPGVGLISPPPHHDIYSIEDLKQLIFDLKNANPDGQVSVKLVAAMGVGTVAAGVAKAYADHILISGHDGGTGASPLTSIKHAGLPWELGIAETHQTLVWNDLRSRVRIETDGGFRTGKDVIVAACLGAEEYGFSTAPLITLGCIMMRKCHLNTCPVGVTTQDEQLRRKFTGQPEHVLNYLFLVANEARQYMANLGVRCIDELIGRTDLLETNQAIKHWKADGLDLKPILQKARPPANRENVGVRKLVDQDHGLENVLDNKIIELAKPALCHGQSVRIDLNIRNTDRAVGTMLSNKISRKFGEEAMADQQIELNLTGSAGQSLGAWLAHGVTIHLEGDANDYLGKGLSGGRIIVTPPKRSNFVPEQNVIAGNVCMYGATRGEAYVRGIAAERFCVRNSGVHAVVEGIGEHGCEYMTGGRVVVLGKTGRNFAAGMSGGIAYVWDHDGDFLTRCNLGMVDLEQLDDEDDATELHTLIKSHLQYTGSTVAATILNDWQAHRRQFVKVMPLDYRRVLEAQKRAALKTEEDMPSVGSG